MTKKPKWIPPRENTGAAATASRGSKFWKEGGVVITTDSRMMKTPHQTTRRKYNK